MWIRETGSEGPWKFFSWISFCITNELHLFFPQSFQMSAVWHKLLYHAWNMFILNWKQVIFSVSSLSLLNKWFFFTAIILCCYLFNTRVPEGIESNAKILRFFYHQLNCRTETHFPSCWADCQITPYISAPFIKNVLSWRKLVHPRLSAFPMQYTSNDWSICMTLNEQTICLNSGQLCRAILSPGLPVWHWVLLLFCSDSGSPHFPSQLTCRHLLTARTLPN